MLNQFLVHRRAASFLLPLYLGSTYPVRSCWTRASCLVRRCPIVILFYHRVADDCPNPWTISRHDFQRQIDWLSNRFDLISLGEVQQRLAQRTSNRPAVSITFDDGYAENCDFALPLLIGRQIPVTYFVASDFVMRTRPFPHDVARGEPLAPNTVGQLKALAEQGVEIGAHTRSHADLGLERKYEKIWSEIAGSRQDLEQMLSRRVRYFAFPYGQRSNITSPAIQVAKHAGFDAVCSAFGGYNFVSNSPFHLLRWHGDPNLWRLKNWVTLDPRSAWIGRKANELS